MSVSNSDHLQQSLHQAISMQLQELPQATDPHSDEALAHQIWQQEMAASATLAAYSHAPVRNTPRLRSGLQHTSQATATARLRPNPQHADQDCSSCIEPTRGRNIVVLECCQTAFCKACFRTWFETALDGNILPSCCGGNIDIGLYGVNLTATMRKKYARVKEELSADRKINCGSARCGKIIIFDSDSPAFVKCRFCKCKTCTSCKDPISAHGKRRTCPNYLDDEELQRIVSSNQWKRCPTCFVPVEKISGCNHIRCTCGSQFCFHCGDRKKSEGDTCECRRNPMALHNQRPAPAAPALTAWAAAVLPEPLAGLMALRSQPTNAAGVGARQPGNNDAAAAQRVNHANQTAVVGQEQGQTQDVFGWIASTPLWQSVSSLF